jgi:hypothetical protein
MVPSPTTPPRSFGKRSRCGAAPHWPTSPSKSSRREAMKSARLSSTEVRNYVDWAAMGQVASGAGACQGALQISGTIMII